MRETERIFREATSYAKTRGVRIAASFEAPRAGDPTDSGTCANFRARVRQFLVRNADISYLALWQHESGGCTGSPPPPPDVASAARQLLEDRRPDFAHLGNDRRVWEAIRFCGLAEIAAQSLKKEAPHLSLVVVGWGGDRWMRFADMCLSFDKFLPADAVFTCHETIDASMDPSVSDAWGKLPAHRQRWAMPWVEGDRHECWAPRPNVEALGQQAPDALAKGCQGLLTLQWRTREMEQETAFAARFAWDTTLSPRRSYRDFARRAFGADQEKPMARRLEALQKQGTRWTGVHGANECGAMVWTAATPHYPWELDESTPDFLAPMAAKASISLSRIPPGTDDPESGAFHLRREVPNDTPCDPTRAGVREMAAIAARLRALSGQHNVGRLRAALREISDDAHAVRYRLVTRGMISAAYSAMDLFLAAIHHMIRNAGAKQRFASLRRMRAELAILRERYVAEKRLTRLERLDYLAASMDFVVPFDTAAMMLADRERIDQAVAQAQQAADAGDRSRAADIAGGAYIELVGAGMHRALQAQTRRLTDKCNFGLLTTINVKAMPAYWQALARLERFLPAAPPRQVTARGQVEEVWISWEPAGKDGA